MKHKSLQNLIGRAIVDKKFRHHLLNGSREQVIAEFDLTEAERNAIRSINTENFAEFASQLHNWIEATNGQNLSRRRRLSGIP